MEGGSTRIRVHVYSSESSIFFDIYVAPTLTLNYEHWSVPSFHFTSCRCVMMVWKTLSAIWGLPGVRKAFRRSYLCVLCESTLLSL